MPFYSSNSRNRLIQAPMLVVSGQGSRLIVTVRDYVETIASGIVAGDVIRYDPPTNTYVKSLADQPINAEVLGVVESVETVAQGKNYSVVVSGSLAYPTARLTAIQNSGTQSSSEGNGYDVLFLDNKVAGGLTGMAPTSGVAKVIVQTAPHGSYNTIVVNYIGYQVGTEAVVNLAGSQIGSVGTVPRGTILDDNLLDASTDQILAIDEYQQLYDVVGNQGKYWEAVVLTDNTVINGSWNDMLYQTSYQLVTGIRYASGIVRKVDSNSKTIWIEKEKGQPLYDSNKPVYITATFGNVLGYIESTNITHFTLPAISTPQITVGSTDVIPYIVAKPSAITYIPKELDIQTLNVDTSLVVNNRNILNEIDQLKTLVDQMNKFYNL